MINIQPKEWKRVSPNFMKEMDFRLKRLTFDGDHALQNNFAVRQNHTIQDVIDAMADYETFVEKKAQKEKAIEEFKKKALKEGLLINLHDVTDKMFFDSEHLNEFWRVCFELHENQKEEKTE